MTKPLIVDYYTDILCVWAWIAQRRIDELNAQLGDKIEIRRYYIDVFGDVAKNIDTGWQQRGGYEGFAEHVATGRRRHLTMPPCQFKNMVGSSPGHLGECAFKLESSRAGL